MMMMMMNDDEIESIRIEMKHIIKFETLMDI